jgi:nucleoside-diphosphate-sugar epimerase
VSGSSDQPPFDPLTALPTNNTLIFAIPIRNTHYSVDGAGVPSTEEGDIQMSGRRLLVTGGSGFIGTNLILEAGRRNGAEILNLDLAAPKLPSISDHFLQCDLLDRKAVERSFAEFQPTHVIHLAARTDSFGTTVDDYVANHLGTEHLVAAIRRTPSVTNAIFTSSQYVVGPGSLPEHEQDFRPHTIYGQSKVLSEKAVREADLQCAWAIVRPTNIWGRWHPRYPTEFWRVLKQGRYVHPGRQRVTRCYGYVGNVVDQMLSLLSREDGSHSGRVFYLGDPPMDLFEWTNAFSMELTGRPVRVVPRLVLKALAKVGDMVVRSGVRCPIFSSRFRSMTEDYVTPMEPTFEALGPAPFSLQDGVKETVGWLRSENAFWN